MDYSELSFALDVRKIARQRMIIEIQDRAKETNSEPVSTKELLAELKEMDLASYVEGVISDAKETAQIIKNIKT